MNATRIAAGDRWSRLSRQELIAVGRTIVKDRLESLGCTVKAPSSKLEVETERVPSPDRPPQRGVDDWRPRRASSEAMWVAPLPQPMMRTSACVVNGSARCPTRISAETILINTGSEPVVPDYRGFGSEVSLFERGPAILAQEDEDIAAVAAAILTEEGIDIHVRAQVTEVHDSDAEATVVYEIGGDRRTVVVDAILAASGRAPATAQLGLEAAGIRVGDRGAIEVDAHLRTSQPHIYALGNVNGGPQHTYISFDDSRIVLDHLIGAGGRSTADRAAVIG